MRHSSRWVSRLLAVAAALAFAAGTPGGHPTAAAEGDDQAVIVSPDVAVEALRLAEVRDVFAFRRRFWSPGLPVTVIYSSESMRAGSVLLTRVYGRDLVGLRRFVMEHINSGEIDFAPRVVSSDEAAVRLVEAGRGLIALVGRDAAAGGKARIVAVDGMMPGTPRYPLRR